jgi:pimeloyl-ACP methyl ester carboxylesterase
VPKTLIDGVELSYRQVGRGPDLVLVHGLGANMAFWHLGLIQTLAQNFRVTLLDLRGHGYSQMPPGGYTPAQMAKDLQEFLGTLSIARAHVVGHSFGGEIGLHLAVDCPDMVRTLTVADTRLALFQPEMRFKDWAEAARWSREFRALGITIPDDQPLGYAMLDLLAAPEFEPVRRAVGKLRFFPFAGFSGGQRSAERWRTLLRTTTARQDFESRALSLAAVGELRAPMLLVYGEYSPCLPSLEGLRRARPDSTVAVVPEAGHFHPAIAPRVFGEHLTSFLAGVPR